MTAPAPIGTTRNHRGQLYTVSGHSVRKRADGSDALILTRTAPCAECGAPFDITTPAASLKFEPNRRCQEHSRPGCRVGGA